MCEKAVGNVESSMLTVLLTVLLISAARPTRHGELTYKTK